MNDSLTPKDISKIIDLGFNGYYNKADNSGIRKWFRDTHQIYGMIELDMTTEPKFCYSIHSYEEGNGFTNEIYPRIYSDLYYSYEDAEVDCIRKMIKIQKVKNEKIF